MQLQSKFGLKPAAVMLNIVILILGCLPFSNSASFSPGCRTGSLKLLHGCEMGMVLLEKLSKSRRRQPFSPPPPPIRNPNHWPRLRFPPLTIPSPPPPPPPSTTASQPLPPPPISVSSPPPPILASSPPESLPSAPPPPPY